MDNNAAVITVFVAYLAALVGLAVLTRRGSGSLSGFFLGDRRLPGWALAFSTNATGESGWLLLGLTGMGYLVGVHALWIVVGEVIGIGLSWALIARRLRRGAGEHDALTVPDFLAARFGDRAHVLRWTAVLIILAMVVTYTSAQVVATGKAFQTFLDWDYRVGAVLGAVVALAYTTVGGFRAVVWTDVLQGVLMLGGLIALPIVGFAEAGGWDAAMDSLRARPSR
jgi:Na+/proline symporter